MRIGFFADAHIGHHRVLGGPVHDGLNRRCQLGLETLARTCRVAADQVDLLCVLGDLLDSDEEHPIVVARTIDALDQFPGPREQIFLLRGNHEETSTSPDHHGLAPFGRAGFQVVESPRCEVLPGAQLWLIPHRPGVAAEWVREALAGIEPQAAGRCRIVASHFGLYDDSFPPWLRGSGALHVDEVAKLMGQYGVDFWLCGDYHQHRRWGPIIQVGALMPADFGDQPPYGGLLILDTQTGQLTQREIPGPRFVSLHLEEIERDSTDRLEQLAQQGHQVHVRIGAPPGRIPEVHGVIRLLAEEGIVVAGEPEPDGTAALESAREVAAQDFSAGSLRASLAEYVELVGPVLGVRDPAQAGRVVELCGELLG